MIQIITVSSFLRRRRHYNDDDHNLIMNNMNKNHDKSFTRLPSLILLLSVLLLFHNYSNTITTITIQDYHPKTIFCVDAFQNIKYHQHGIIHHHYDDILLSQRTIIQNKPSLLSRHDRKNVQQHQHKKQSIRLFGMISNDNDSNEEQRQQLDIVIMGIGDLRVDDHGGLYNALYSSTNNNNIILPIFIWNNEMITNIPGIVSHTYDTCYMISNALCDINKSLQKECNDLQLHYLYDNNDNNNLHETLYNFIETKICPNYNNINTNNIRIHVCNLGDADNSMKYNPYSMLMNNCNNNNKQLSNNMIQMEIIQWNQNLRQQSWNDVNTVIDYIPDTYPEYEKKYIKSNIPIQPFDILSLIQNDYNNNIPTTITLPEYQTIPNGEEIFQTVFNVLLSKNRNVDQKTLEQQCYNEKCTGIYLSHYGGLSYESIKSSIVLQTVKSYKKDYNENDQEWMTSSTYNSLLHNNNPCSLEHSSMKWQLNNINNNNSILKSQNWMKGECMIRYVSIPLFLGTISSRRIWYEANANNNNDWFSQIISSTSSTPLQQLVEGNEWHKLLATKNIRTQPLLYCPTLYRNNNNNNQGDDITSTTVVTTTPSLSTTYYQYWRYHGFLCRYAYTPFITTVDQNNNNDNNNNKNGLLLVHGFGASGTQYNKVMKELSTMIQTNQQDKDKEILLLSEGLAPDLIGFGHSEKPSISYTGYMWDSQMLDFVKDIAIHQYQWNSYITGGNSIGGYTSLSLAASDYSSTILDIDTTDTTNTDTNVMVSSLSSSGSPGTQRCIGLVLMNSAGPIQTKEEIELLKQQQQASSSSSSSSSLSVAQMTTLGLLEPCKALPRFMTRTIGNVLLSYLQPNIQSICKNLYPTNPNAVDNDLCVNNILRDSLDIGAINVMMAGSKLPPPRTANELLNANFGNSASNTISSSKKNNLNGNNHNNNTVVIESVFNGPVLIAQGVLDPLNNSTDRMNRFTSLRDNIISSPIEAGHCPHDELPEQMAHSILTWSSSLSTTTSEPEKTISTSNEKASLLISSTTSSSAST